MILYTYQPRSCPFGVLQQSALLQCCTTCTYCRCSVSCALCGIHMCIPRLCPIMPSVLVPHTVQPQPWSSILGSTCCLPHHPAMTCWPDNVHGPHTNLASSTRTTCLQMQAAGRLMPTMSFVHSSLGNRIVPCIVCTAAHGGSTLCHLAVHPGFPTPAAGWPMTCWPHHCTAAHTPTRHARIKQRACKCKLLVA